MATQIANRAPIARLGGRAARSNARREEMAVRRQLRELFGDPRPVGAVVVERASAPAPTACVPLSPPPSSSLPPAPVPASPLRQQPRELRQDPRPVGAIVERAPALAAIPWVPPSPPPSSSLPPAPVPASPPRQRGSLPKECAVFHCRGCWTVLGDSLQLCGQEPPGLNILICFKVTDDVTWEDSLLLGLEGALLGCAYYLLSCQSCGLAVGFILHSSASDLAYLRGLFCFFKESIICYLLKDQMIIEASKVQFPAVTLKEQMHKVKEKLVEFHARIDLVMKKLEELEQNNYVTE